MPSPHTTLRYANVREYTDLPQITISQVQHFFEHYKDLEPGKWVKLEGWGSPEEAKEEIRTGVRRYRKPVARRKK